MMLEYKQTDISILVKRLNRLITFNERNYNAEDYCCQKLQSIFDEAKFDYGFDSDFAKRETKSGIIPLVNFIATEKDFYNPHLDIKAVIEFYRKIKEDEN